MFELYIFLSQLVVFCMAINKNININDINDQGEAWSAYKKTALENEFLKNRVRELYQQIDHLDRDLKILKKREGVDESTGLGDQTYFQRHLSHEFDRARRYCHFFSVILMHLSLGATEDTVNYDHQIRLLKIAFENLRRRSDIIARYQKKQIVLLLPETEETGAENLAERLSAAVNLQEGQLRYKILIYPSSASKCEDLLTAVRELSTELHRLK